MRIVIAFVLFGVAVLAAIVTLVGLVNDVIGPPQGSGIALAQSGYTAGAIVGVVLRTIIFGAIFIGVFRLGLSFYAPEKYSRAAITKRRLQEIAEEHASSDGSEPPADAKEFMKWSNAELVDIYRHIDRKRYPERFEALIWVIHRRREAVRSQSFKWSKLSNYVSAGDASRRG